MSSLPAVDPAPRPLSWPQPMKITPRTAKSTVMATSRRAIGGPLVNMNDIISTSLLPDKEQMPVTFARVECRVVTAWDDFATAPHPVV